MLAFLEYIFQLFKNKALPASNSVVGGSGFDSHRWKLSFLFFLGSFCVLFLDFRKSYFHFLTNLKYTGTLIAG